MPCKAVESEAKGGKQRTGSAIKGCGLRPPVSWPLDSLVLKLYAPPVCPVARPACAFRVQSSYESKHDKPTGKALREPLPASDVCLRDGRCYAGVDVLVEDAATGGLGSPQPGRRRELFVRPRRRRRSLSCKTAAFAASCACTRRRRSGGRGANGHPVESPGWTPTCSVICPRSHRF